jgi:cell division protein FtsI/penicillin-binding protein 2
MRSSSKIRSVLIFILFLGLYLILLINLYFIQIRQTDFFNTLANRQYHITLTTCPSRGEILDRHGHPLALNKEQLSAFILPRQLQDEQLLKAFLQKHFPASLERLDHFREKHFMYIARRLPEHFCDLAQCDQVGDLKFMKEPSRFYVNDALGPVVGITNIDNHGLFGLEQQYDQFLAGTPTKVMLKKDARSDHFYFKQDLQASGEQGNNLYLTIDSDLQFMAHEALANRVNLLQAESGAVIIMDPKNGEILSLASYPDFDPNSPQELEQAYTRLIPVTDSYEFGSMMKVFVALAALAEGVVGPDELIDCEDQAETRIDGMRFTTTPSSVSGEIPFSEVVARSNNIGMVKVAKRLNEKLYDHYLKLGFGNKTGLNFLAEQAGHIFHPAKWSKRSIISLSFGYEITATLLQVARAFSAIANGGYLVTPKLVLNEETALPVKIYDHESVEVIQGILRGTVQHGTGTRAKIRGYDVIGKTGTAKIALNGAYAEDQLILSFVGSVQKGNYNRVIATCIKKTQGTHNTYGANTAAPLFEEIAEQMLVHNKVV